MAFGLAGSKRDLYTDCTASITVMFQVLRLQQPAQGREGQWDEAGIGSAKPRHFTKCLALAKLSAPELGIPFQEAADEKGHCSFRGSLLPSHQPHVSLFFQGHSTVLAWRHLREHQVLGVPPERFQPWKPRSGLRSVCPEQIPKLF